MLKVVVSDDNPLVLQSIVTTIDWAELGCTIAGSADNGEDARQIIAERRADIIISDIKMLGMDGLELAGAVNDMGIHAKMILITGFQEFELAQQALKLGVFDLLAKPVSNSEICRAVKSAAESLLLERRKNPRLMPTRAPEEASPIVRRAVAYLEQMFREDITLEDISEKLVINPSYLSRAIKKETGRGFVEILTEIRLDIAKQLLEQPNAKVYSVAEQVGYKEYPYFYQVFKKHCGISPKEYRKQFS